jgi:hypothetical protein
VLSALLLLDAPGVGMPASNCRSAAVWCCCWLEPLLLLLPAAAAARASSTALASSGLSTPHEAAMAVAVAALSPVMIRTAMPARWQSAMAPGTSARTAAWVRSSTAKAGF